MRWQPELLEGVNVLEAPGRAGADSVTLRLIPFYAHANRGDDSHWVTFLPFGR
jgi:hypothetical protein